MDSRAQLEQLEIKVPKAIKVRPAQMDSRGVPGQLAQLELLDSKDQLALQVSEVSKAQLELLDSKDQPAIQVSEVSKAQLDQRV
jgi:hypothetical protein